MIARIGIIDQPCWLAEAFKVLLFHSRIICSPAGPDMYKVSVHAISKALP